MLAATGIRFPRRLEISSLPDGMDSRTRRQSLIDLQNRLDSNPQTPIGLAGLLCCQARVEILGESKIGLSRETGITRDTLAKLEAGISEPNTYRQLLDFFRSQVLAIIPEDPVRAMRLESFRTRISTLLVCESALEQPLNRMMLQLGYRYGQAQFEQHADFNLVALRARDKNGGTGNIQRNFQAVTGVLRNALAEEGRLERNGQTATETLWKQKEVQQFIALSVAERMKSLSGVKEKDPQGVQLSGVLLTLVALRGASNREALGKHFGIATASARALTRGELVEPEAVRKILKKLTVEDYIPGHVADSVLADWQTLYGKRTYTAQLPAVAASIHAGLEAQQLDTAQTAKLLGISKTSPGFVLRKQIDDVSIESGLFSFHSLCCLAAPTLSAAESLVEAALACARRLPKNAGREFSYPYQLAVMYGLSAADFPESIAGHVRERYAGTERSTPREIIDTIMERGDEISIRTLEAYLKLMEPRTVTEVANALDDRHSKVAPHLTALGMAQTTLRKYQSEDLFPGLRRVKDMLVEAGVLPSTGLVVDWYTRAAAKFTAGQDAFERAIPVLVQAAAGNAKSFYLEMSAAEGSSPSMSLREFQRLVTEYSRGNRLEKESDQAARDTGIIEVLRAGGVRPEVLQYLTLCRETESAPLRIERWRSAMQSAGNDALVQGLDELLQKVPELLQHKTPETLEEAFIEKIRITEALNTDSARQWQVLEENSIFRALSCLPGVTTAELTATAEYLRSASVSSESE